MAQLPPNVDGIMEITNTEKQAIISKLNAIKEAFVATEDTLTCDTFHLVATYNMQNSITPINGDTAEELLK